MMGFVDSHVRRPMEFGKKPAGTNMFDALQTSAESDLRVVSRMAYFGHSMNPTLIEPEIIDVIKISPKEIRKGDVIVFYRPDDTITNVVHRVVDMSREGFRTRGDNSLCADPYWVTGDQIIGQVVASWRGNRRQAIHGGIRGRFISLSLLCKVYILTSGGRLWTSGYRLLSCVSSPLAQLMLPVRLQPRLIQYPDHARWRFQLFIGNKFIGRYDATTREWEIRRPYRLLVDVGKLPHPE